MFPVGSNYQPSVARLSWLDEHLGCQRNARKTRYSAGIWSERVPFEMLIHRVIWFRPPPQCRFFTRRREVEQEMYCEANEKTTDECELWTYRAAARTTLPPKTLDRGTGCHESGLKFRRARGWLVVAGPAGNFPVGTQPYATDNRFFSGVFGRRGCRRTLFGSPVFVMGWLWLPAYWCMCVPLFSSTGVLCPFFSHPRCDVPPDLTVEHYVGV